MRVHKTLGPGFLESAIRFSLLVNFGRAQLQYETFDLERLSTVPKQEINSDLSEPSLTLRPFWGSGGDAARQKEAER